MTILEMPLDAVGYGRVSTGGQDEALSVDTQAAKMDDKAKKEGFQIVKLFRETSSGTSVRKRLAFQAMIQFVLNPANNIKAVFFYDPSRYTRDITDFYIYLRDLTKAGIEVYSVTLDQYKPGDETSEITWGVNALFNSIMPRQTARKTRDAQFQATLMGYYLSPYTPFGFEKYKITVEKKEHTKLRPHPKQWEHALKMWEMGLAKYTPMQVAQYNNDLGIRNNEGNDWTDALVRDFYRNPACRGATVRGRVQESELIPNGEPLAVCENAHQAMVTPEQWDRVDGYIAERHNAPAGPRSHSSLNLLSGRIFCGHCASPMHVGTNNDGTKSFICSKKKHKSKAACPESENPQLKDVLSEVVTALLERVLTKESLNQQVTAVAQENESFLSEQQADREQLQKAQSLAKLQIKNLVTAIENADTDTDTDKNRKQTPDPELYTRLNKRRSDLQNLESRIEELDAIMGDHLMFLNNPDLIVRNALDIRTYLESDDEQTARVLVQSFVNKVVIHNKIDGTIYYSIPLPSDGPDPTATQEIQFSRGRDNKICPLDGDTGITARQTRKVPVRLTLMVFTQSAMSLPCNAPMGPEFPALLTSTSIRPNRSTTRWANRSVSFWLVTSVRTAIASAPSSDAALTTSCSSDSLRAASASLAPSRA